MKKYLFALLLLVTPVFAQRPALNSPVIRFSDQNGRPLSFGKLYSYSAGTTTPLPTYKDSTTGALNTNPVILDGSGASTVFLGPNVYKLVLQDAFGVTIWTADNIAQGVFEAGFVTSFTGYQGSKRTGDVVAAAGDYNCSQITGAICTLPPAPTQYYQTVKAGGVAAVQEPIINFVAGVPGSVVNPTVTAGGSGYTGAPSVTFTGGTCVVMPTASANIAAGAVTALVINSAGAGCATPPAVSFSGGGGSGATATVNLQPNGISCSDNPAGHSTDCTFTVSGGSTSGGTCTLTDVTGSRSLGVTYQNTTNSLMYVSGFVNTRGSAVGSVYVSEGTASADQRVYQTTGTATVNNGAVGFFSTILPGYFYQVSGDGAVTGLGKLVEVTGCGGGGGGGGTPTYPGGSLYQLQFNNGSTFGGTQMTVDATGKNLSTPGTVNSSSLNTVASTCTSLQSFDTYTCNGIYASFHAAADGGDAQYIGLTVDGANGAGHNWGNYGGWSYRHGLAINVKSSMRGITEGMGMNVTAHAHGDLGGLYAYIHGACVAAALSDEVCFALAAGIDNFNDQFYGTVPTGTSGVGLTSFSPTYTSGLTFLMDEGFLLNTSRGVIHTNLTGPSYTVPGTTMPQYGDLLHAIPVTAGSVPVTTSYCLAIQQAGGPMIVPIPAEPKGQPKSVTFSCTVQPINGTYTAMPSSGVMMVAGANYPEQAPITAAGAMDPASHVQSLTMLLRNPNESIAVFNNGTHAGGLFSFDDDFAYSSTANASVGGHPMRRAIYGVGSLDGNSIVFQYNRFGHTGSVSKMPIDGVSVAGPTSGVTLFTNYAEIVQSKSFDGAVPVLEANAATWNAGDTLEGDSQPAVAFKSLSLGVSMGLPCDPSAMCNLIQGAFSGAGINGAAHGIDIQNGNPASVYKVAGGKMDAPEAISFGGVFSVGTGYQYAPQALFKITQAPGGNSSTVMNLFQFSTFGLTDAIHFDTHRRDLDSVDFGNDSTAPTQPCGDTARGSTHIASVGYVANCAGSGGGTLAGQVSGPVNATVVNSLGPNVAISSNGITYTNPNAGNSGFLFATTGGGSQQFIGDGSIVLTGTPGCSYCGYINFGGIISSVNAGHDMTFTAPSGNDFIFKSQGSGGLTDLLHYHSGLFAFATPTAVTGLLNATAPSGAVALNQLSAYCQTNGTNCPTSGSVTLAGDVTGPSSATVVQSANPANGNLPVYLNSDGYLSVYNGNSNSGSNAGTSVANSSVQANAPVATISASGQFHETLMTPTSSTQACIVGDFGDDANYHYVCTSTNVWKRVALNSF